MISSTSVHQHVYSTFTRNEKYLKSMCLLKRFVNRIDSNIERLVVVDLEDVIEQVAAVPICQRGSCSEAKKKFPSRLLTGKCVAIPLVGYFSPRK